MKTFVARERGRALDIGYIAGTWEKQHPLATKIFVWFPSKDHPADFRSVEKRLLRPATDIEIEILRVECDARGVCLDDLTKSQA